MRTRAAGFTLVELLVALVIVGLLATMMTSALSFLAKAEDRRAELARGLEASLGGIGIVREALGRAQPFYVGGSDAKRLVFEGRAGRVRFVAREPDYLPGPPLVAYELALTGGGAANRIELRRAVLSPTATDLDVLDEAPARVLLSLPRPLSFSYFGAPGRTTPPRWTGAWEAARALPTAVRIAEGTEPGWPEIVVRLAVDTPASCLSGGGDSPECRS